MKMAEKEVLGMGEEYIEEKREGQEEISFAELLEQSSQTPGSRFSPGDRITGKIVKIGRDTVFVDLGGKSEGLVEADEFRNEDGGLSVREGDEVELRISSLRGGIHLSKAIRVHGADAVRVLREAHQNQIPVEGRVAAVNKGGFEVEISGLRAFCPISQIDLPYCERPEEHIGARYQFRIMELKDRGKNIIVSRRVLLQEEQEKKLKETMAALKPDLEMEGRVTKVANFGAFVDIGGVEGMVHVSEITHGRVENPSEVLHPGQMVRVKILRIEPEKNGRQRIALSMKALEPDAWDRGLSFQEGDVISGRVSRLADFGAFVEVAPGVDGLVYRSEISYEKVSHPSRFLKAGEEVSVRVLKIDQASRRISLSIKDAAIPQRIREEEGEARLEVGQILNGIVEDQKPYGLFVRLPQLGLKARGLLPLEELVDSDRSDVKRRLPPGKEIVAEIIAIDGDNKIRLSQKSIKDKEDRGEFEKFIQKGKKPGSLGTLGDIFKKLKD
jgi:small subunit ribosomal protein S1